MQIELQRSLIAEVELDGVVAVYAHCRVIGDSGVDVLKGRAQILTVPSEEDRLGDVVESAAHSVARAEAGAVRRHELMTAAVEDGA